MAIRTFKSHTPHIGDKAYIDSSAQVIGRVEIGTDTSVWPNTTIRGDVNWIKIGDNSNIQDGSVLHVTNEYYQAHEGGYPLSIGSQVTVGHNVVLHGCTIEDNVLIGMGAIVMDNAVVKSGSIVAAGAVVLADTIVEPGYIYAGTPAKKVKPVGEELKGVFSTTAKNYIKYAKWFTEGNMEY